MMRQIKITSSITNRDSASLEHYLSDISKVPCITPEEEVELAQRVKAGDQAALDRLVTANLRFVVSIAKNYQNQGVSLIDLINEGNIGLMKAASRFDETRGFKFISYAVWWIRQGIINAISEQSRIVRLPLNQITTINNIKKEVAKLEQTLQRAPSLDEIAAAVDLPTYKVVELLKLTSRTQALEAPSPQNEDSKLIDTLIFDNDEDTDKGVMKESLREDLKTVLSNLPDKEQQVLRLYYGFDTTREYTLDEISVLTQLSRERVRQIRERAIKRLRTSINKDNLKQYL